MDDVQFFYNSSCSLDPGSGGVLHFRVAADNGATDLRGWKDFLCAQRSVGQWPGSGRGVVCGGPPPVGFRAPSVTDINGIQAMWFDGVNDSMDPVEGHDGDDWAFAHDGSGVTVFAVTAVSGWSRVFHTGRGGFPGLTLSYSGTNFPLRLYAPRVMNSSIQQVISHLGNAFSGDQDIVTWRFSMATSPDSVLRVNGRQVSTANALASPSTGPATYGAWMGPNRHGW